ncbi:helix-turn-helix transcriptional regulator [Candidatus Parcubacteria bacterium]|nr:helix-turn-helix transcriptional regulator [Candidatus Parcubacteria bacterium]
MSVNVENQERLRNFLKEVRMHKGLSSVGLGKLIGMQKSMIQAFEKGGKSLGHQSVRKIGRRLKFSSAMVAALLDPEAGPIDFPAPESVVLEAPDSDEDILIDLEKAEKIMELVKIAGKPIPLSMLAYLVR